MKYNDQYRYACTVAHILHNAIKLLNPKIDSVISVKSKIKSHENVTSYFGIYHHVKFS